MEEESEGEIELILEDLKRETEEVMHELSEMEDTLIKMKESIETGKVDRDKLLEQVSFLRGKIGLLEHLDSKEFEEEKSASDLMSKLKSMIDKCM